jgi:RHS repeat-associated protein
VPTDNRFTGQKEDASGLVYMNARYYDPVTGQFVSPDTLVPDATNLFDYNRYMYVRGNPLKYTDPTGHCSVTEDGQRADDDRDCWAYVYEILRLWSIDPTYWDQRFVSQENFLEKMAPQSVLDRDWMFGQYDEYLRSEDYRRVYNLQQEKRKELPTQSVSYGPGPCEIWDCPAIAMDLASLGLSVAQTGAVACTATGVAAPACGPSAAYLTSADVGLRLASISYEGYRYSQGESTTWDLSIAVADGAIKPILSAAGAGASVTPGVGVVYDLVMLGYDLLVDPFFTTPGAPLGAK